MARGRTKDPRFDFRGGANTTFSEDVLDATEVRRAQNITLSEYGAATKREGTQRIHAAALAGDVDALLQWSPAAGKRLLALAGGTLYTKAEADADFTVAAAGFGQGLASLLPYRIGAALKVLVADGVGLRTWDNAAASAYLINAPAGRLLALYKLRAYTAVGKTLYGSKVGDPEKFAVADGGVFADVELFDGDDITGLCVVGSSLLIAKANSIARFTGVDTREIRLDVETEGVSAEVGVIAPRTFIRLEASAFGISDRGPFLCTESGLELIGLKVEKEFDFANRALWSAAVAVHHRARKEVRVHLPAQGEGGNLTTWVYNYRTQSWTGPWLTPYAVTCAVRYEATDGTETLVLGGGDGYVRRADLGTQDDVLANASGGTPVVFDLEFAPFLAGAPERLKHAAGVQTVQADVPDGASLVAYWESELGSGETAIAGSGGGTRNYRFRWDNAKGCRLVMGFRQSTAHACSVAGFVPSLTIGRTAR